MAQLPNAVQRLLDGLTNGDWDGMEQHMTPNAVLDVSVPDWRYQHQGPDRIVEEFRNETARGSWRIEPTITQAGDTVVVEADEYLDTEKIRARAAYVFELRDGKIAEIRVYCSGEWSEETVRKIEAEAPKVDRDKALA